jgi:uncharacterized YigZ family protein
VEDCYYTIEKPAQAEIKRKGSRFIGEAILVTDTDDARHNLELVRKREHAATHHCYAWQVGLGRQVEFKYSDDGEPNGTAGRPIYEVVGGRELTNLLLVVTRYYGGTKLGTGGLARAYRDAAVEVLEISGRRQHYLTTTLTVVIEFGLYDQLLKLIHAGGVQKVESDFADRVTLKLSVIRSRAEKLKADIVQLSSGRATIEEE